MASGIDSILGAALALPANERVALAEQLLESLEGTDQAEIDAAWAAEADRRIEALEKGDTALVPGDEVLRWLSDRAKQS